ncbi:hypothetical protein C8A03DRAFT_32367 [Achaetomium macrosporum]|uniref:Haloacid dehalogenase n=1 Tax=Achaetomium macrosporum TaxID=79813 RepID=A0AAN7CCH1_9PEZI|nr:hypothetical protein C8A03DRAFT_32367 [Achaetomium macrosporum]
MGRRNLLLCFDAFGTLFKPRQPIAEQYAAVARECGLNGFTTEQLQAAFKTAFSGESKAHPNYGRATGMGAEKWWTNVIHKTFQHLIGASRKLPEALAPRLLHRFSSREGYSLAPQVDSLLRSLKHRRQQQQRSSIAVGVITNSDDRVPSILSSLGLRVSPLRFGSSIKPVDPSSHDEYDIDLLCLSYDVGFAKPDRRIFDAAEDMANQLLPAAAAQEEGKPVRVSNSGPATEDAASLLKLYVGDEFEKDVVGARDAGWNAVFVGTDADIGGQDIDMLDLDRLDTSGLEEVFPDKDTSPVTIRADSTQAFLKWLIERSAAGG